MKEALDAAQRRDEDEKAAKIARDEAREGEEIQTTPSKGSISDSLSKLLGEPAPAKQETPTEKSVKEEADFASQADSISAVRILHSRLIL